MLEEVNWTTVEVRRQTSFIFGTSVEIEEKESIGFKFSSHSVWGYRTCLRLVESGKNDSRFGDSKE